MREGRGRARCELAVGSASLPLPQLRRLRSDPPQKRPHCPRMAQLSFAFASWWSNAARDSTLSRPGEARPLDESSDRLERKRPAPARGVVCSGWSRCHAQASSFSPQTTPLGRKRRQVWALRGVRWEGSDEAAEATVAGRCLLPPSSLCQSDGSQTSLHARSYLVCRVHSRPAHRLGYAESAGGGGKVLKKGAARVKTGLSQQQQKNKIENSRVGLGE